MTNADDIFGELTEAYRLIVAGQYNDALEAIDQAAKLWQAERDYWALIEVDAKRSRVDL